MKLETHYRAHTRESVFCLTLDDMDLLMAPLDGLDAGVIRECDGPDATISDKLLALEIIARRVEQARGGVLSPPATPAGNAQAPGKGGQ